MTHAYGRVLNARLEEIIKEHLEKKERYKNTGREEEMEYDTVDILIKAMENEDLEVPITLNDIKAVILVSTHIYIYIYIHMYLHIYV